MAEMAASGGYYLSLSADHMVAQETTITGSIGVIIQTFNISDGLNRFGIQARAITSGVNKDLVNPVEPARESHYKIMQGLVDEFYDSFRSLVINRCPGIPGDRVDEVTDGRVFTGKQAMRLGLVDENGGLREAFGACKRLAGVAEARLVKYHIKGRDPGSAYASARAPAGVDAQGMEMHVRVQAPSIPGSGFYYLWSPGL
jgi:protease-4